MKVFTVLVTDNSNNYNSTEVIGIFHSRKDAVKAANYHLNETYSDLKNEYANDDWPMDDAILDRKLVLNQESESTLTYYSVYGGTAITYKIQEFVVL